MTHPLAPLHMPTPRPRIGFIGTGLMGGPMVLRLLEAGHTVTVWNRTPSKLAPLVQAGATAAASPAELARQSEIVCCCLSDTAAVEDAVFGAGALASGLGRSAVLVDFSSIDPQATARMAARLTLDVGAQWVDAPVSGGVPAARTGKLIVFAGGEEHAVRRASVVFDTVAQRTTHMGAVGSGQYTKSFNQQLVACNMLVIAEMLALAERLGIDASRIPGALAGGFADSLPLQLFGPRMAKNTEIPRLAAVGTFLKDIEQVGRLASETHAIAPLTETTLVQFRRAAARDDIGADAEVSRLIALVREPAARPAR
jgi:3-hydroxyisobutyrate dehydrogenase